MLGPILMVGESFESIRVIKAEILDTIAEAAAKAVAAHANDVGHPSG